MSYAFQLSALSVPMFRMAFNVHLRCPMDGVCYHLVWDHVRVML